MAELAWSDFGCKARVKVHVWDGGKRAGTKENRDYNHPAQKPVEVMEWCIKYSNGSDACGNCNCSFWVRTGADDNFISFG